VVFRHGFVTVCLGLWTSGMLLSAGTASAQSGLLRADADASLVAIQCELRSLRSPDTDQTLFFYLSDARRLVLDTAGNVLGNVVQFGPQRILIAKPNAEGGARTYTFDRMIGALTITGPLPAGTREGWTLSGECRKVDASRKKF
jgi:hypothetical protein